MALAETKHLEGDTAELGVYYGGTSRFIAANNNNAIHHAYDTFEGIPENDVCENGYQKGEFAATDSERVLRVLNLPNIKVHKGLFPATAIDAKYKLVHIDVDIYQSTKAGLEFFVPRMVIGGIIILDDLDWKLCPGVRKACNDLNLFPRTAGEWQGILKF
jgi:hypothetical protein